MIYISYKKGSTRPQSRFDGADRPSIWTRSGTTTSNLFTCAFPYHEPVAIQWQSSGNPVYLEFRPQCSLECHWKQLLVANVFPVVFQWPSSGIRVCSIMQINIELALEHHWVIASASVSQCSLPSGIPVYWLNPVWRSFGLVTSQYATPYVYNWYCESCLS